MSMDVYGRISRRLMTLHGIDMCNYLYPSGVMKGGWEMPEVKEHMQQYDLQWANHGSRWDIF